MDISQSGNDVRMKRMRADERAVPTARVSVEPAEARSRPAPAAPTRDKPLGRLRARWVLDDGRLRMSWFTVLDGAAEDGFRRAG